MCSINISFPFILQSAIFNFQSLLTVILLLICTCAYIRAMAPSLLDKNKTGYDRVLNSEAAIRFLPAIILHSNSSGTLSCQSALLNNCTVYHQQLAVFFIKLALWCSCPGLSAYIHSFFIYLCILKYVAAKEWRGAEGLNFAIIVVN